MPAFTALCAKPMSFVRSAPLGGRPFFSVKSLISSAFRAFSAAPFS